MTDRLRWGILATGGIAHAFTSDLKLNGFDVRAVGSRTQGSADAFAAEFDIPTAYGSYEQLAADPEIDVIYVSTPHPFHAEGATLALEGGKHVLVEKAFSLNEAEARRVADLAASKGLLVLEAMWTRYLPHMVRIREIIAEGTLGELRTLIADHTQKLPDDPSHRLNALELGGGALLDLGIYPISFAWDLFGKPSTIQATATFKPTGADAQIATIFGYEGSRIALTLSASDARGHDTATIVGTEARIDIDDVWYTPTTFRVVSYDGSVLEEYRSEVNGRGMQFQAAALERLVAEGNLAGDILPIEETVGIMGTLDAIREQIGLRYPGE
ncbi:Gfo/Idh/MocA family protein [Agromyces aerolatus]|uniref:Gfo/Idh/MocA family protein n=1 Tax=Agromyces sp. LY-1074 TaxID=3074080 RepID=UPI00285FA636|nr:MULTISPECIES: Gfo/Idh/MocA family oxidoreductase [unclassified Agromyces]MDR5700271.1 Gfo/Idh/MocA family oxidoreductase [Agromyces sp. LY-1074]MDR5706751.1 Gfo/Idh/MocA family oxidoreductase [Agromyces sp. LY-1358]